LAVTAIIVILKKIAMIDKKAIDFICTDQDKYNPLLKKLPLYNYLQNPYLVT